MLSPEELLVKRFMCIGSGEENHYPGSINKIGDIITARIPSVIERLEKYPHLYRPMKWWECRLVQEMPKYIDIKSSMRQSRFFEVYRWQPNSTGSELFPSEGELSFSDETVQIAWHFFKNQSVPITQQEYIDFQNTKDK